MSGASLLRADAIRLPLADASVDLICTSPPYWSLRSYRDGGEHFAGQIGSEPTPRDFLEALWTVTAECVRVLKPTGSLFVNLGDKYAGSGGHNNAGISQKSTLRGNGHIGGEPKIKSTLRSAPDRYNQAADVRAKSLMGLPWLYANGCTGALAALGGPDPGLNLILRAEIVWSKPNGLPESVNDRVRRSHEQWFMFTKSPHYFAAVDELRLPLRGEIVESAPKFLPLCTLCNRPPDPLAPTCIGGGHEGMPGVETLDLTHEKRSYQGIENETPSGTHEDHAVVADGSPIDALVEVNAATRKDGADPPQDVLVTVVNGDTQMGGPSASMAEVDAPLAVDDPGQPGAFCRCVHPHIILRQSTPLGKLPGSVWTVATEPLQVPDWLGVDHFAAFPQEWPRRFIAGWCPTGICTRCGEGRRPIVERRFNGEVDLVEAAKQRDRSAVSGGDRSTTLHRTHHIERSASGYACACPTPNAPTRPAVVLDPMGGTGTTAMVARALGRYGITVDLSADYLRLARWRIFTSGHGAKSRSRSDGEAQQVLL